MNPPLLEVRGVGKTYVLRHQRRGGHNIVRAVDDISFVVRQGESVGIAGESGSGKSTLARIILRLDRPTDGEIRFAGEDIASAEARELMAYRRRVQAVFQNSSGALSPRMRIRDIVAEPLVVQQPDTAPEEIDRRVDDLLGRVGLSPQLRLSFPHELSGGQKQRVAIARSLVVNPSMLILDEPVSALDVSVRSQVLNLLLDLQEERGLTYLMIAHDLAILRHVTTYLIIMYLGRVVEQGPTEEVLSAPQHPYTRALVAASPRFERIETRAISVKEAETTSTTKNGCAFAPRCPLAEMRCLEDVPHLMVVGECATASHQAACHSLKAVADLPLS